MNLIRHAKDELNKVGLLDKGSDYDGMLGEAVLELIEEFAEQGHSGYSAGATVDLFNRLARFQTLSPITSDSNEWRDVSEYAPNEPRCWQNKRDPSYFSKDGGKTWYNLYDLLNSRSFKIKRAIRWFFQNIRVFVKYKVLRIKKPVIDVSSYCIQEACVSDSNTDKPTQ